MTAGSALINPTHLIRHAAIEPGMRVAQFGCGHTGHFLFPAAKHVGEEGFVYGIDLISDHLRMLENYRRAHALHHLRVLQGDFEHEWGVPLESRSLDRVVLVNRLWSVQNIAGTINEMRRLLVPGGVAFVVDWRDNATHPVAPKESYRLNHLRAQRAFASQGARVEPVSIGSDHWGMRVSFLT